MPRPISFVIIAIAALYALISPRLDRAGVRRPVHGYNNDDCFAVPGLEACEDAAWVDQESGTAYLCVPGAVSRQLRS
jgi:arylesterase/paraoxonase